MDSEAAQWVKVIAIKPEDMSSSPWTDWRKSPNKPSLIHRETAQ